VHIDESKVINPFFFEEPMVTGHTFLGMMNTALRHVHVGTIFQLDSAPPNFSSHVCALLNRGFSNHWTERRGGGNPWPPLSPDLTSLDSFF